LIQAGIDEEVAGGTDIFTAWWSDNRVQYIPEGIKEPLAPGDEVSVRIFVERGTWNLSMIDSSKGWHYIRRFLGLSSQPYDSADWLQEDPAYQAGSPIPDASYPTVRLVEFRDLEVNGSAPLANSLTSLVMHLPGGASIVPSRFAADGFTDRMIGTK
jgi:hypothetical protein